MIFFRISAQEVSEDLANSTDEIDLELDNEDGGPGVAWGPPSRFFELSYFSTTPFDLASTGESQAIGDDQSVVTKYEEIFGKLKFPIFLGDRTQIIGGFQYRYHEYNFENPDGLAYPLYIILENKHLNRLRFDQYLVHHIRRGRYIVGKSGVQLSGDYRSKTEPLGKFLKVYGSAVHVWKVRDNFAWGLGVYYAHQGGRNSIYPALTVNYWHNRKWGIEAIVPAQASFIYRINDNNFLSFQYTVASTRYLIADRNFAISDLGSFSLARNDVQVFLQYQRSLYKFVWFSGLAGYNRNWRFNIFRTQLRSADNLILNDASASPFFQVGIFLTIPEGLRSGN